MALTVEDIVDKIPATLAQSIRDRGISSFRRSQEKAIAAGLLERQHLLVCTPTASGKTLIAEMAAVKNVLDAKGKAVYVVPLRALASEKFTSFKLHFPSLKVGMATGDLDEKDAYLGRNDIIVVTAEKLDSLLRHKVSWLQDIFTIIVDELHLINDASRGPTLEIVMTLLFDQLSTYQFVGLSATVGNPDLIASWIGAQLVEDTWRPVALHTGTYFDQELVFHRESESEKEE